MSLQETTLINIIKGLNNGTFMLDDRLPAFYIEMIEQYTKVELKDAFIRSVLNEHFKMIQMPI